MADERRFDRGMGIAAWAALWVLCVLGWVASGCRPSAKPVEVPPPVVQVATVTTTNVPLEAEFIGRIDATDNVEVRARVEAFVEAVLFEEGGTVEKDALLFRLDRKPYEQQFAAAQGMLAEAEATLKKARQDVARLEPLAEKKAIPLQDLDNAKASVDVALANVQSAQARVEGAQLNLDYCEVRAPVAGMIGAKQVSVGSLVGRGEPTLLATLSPLDPIWVYCSISEVKFLDAERAIKGAGKSLDRVEVTLITSDDKVYDHPGRIVFVDRVVDPKTGTIKLRAAFENPTGMLRPGMFGRLKMRAGEDRGALLVPQSAVIELQGKNFLWVLNAQNLASQKGVTVGKRYGNDWRVLEGLQEGDRIVVEGIQKVREGQPVTPASGLPAPAGAAGTETPAGE